MYDIKKQFCLFMVLYLFDTSLSKTVIRRLRLPKSPSCDKSRAEHIREGNFGQSERCPWLGLLQVKLYDGNVTEEAVTGLVLVKDGFAIANANDINRIPIIIFVQDSTVMFILKRGKPWFTTPKGYLIHPEYGVSTYNTLAIVELDLGKSSQARVKPICWPDRYFDTSKQLYAMGFTDENTVLEKVLHSTKHIEPELCTQFYRNFTEPKSAPTHMLCRLAAKNKNDCFWANGIALVSNSTGQWTLIIPKKTDRDQGSGPIPHEDQSSWGIHSTAIYSNHQIGFGVSGMGCSTPARFIDTTAYLPWIQSATDPKEVSSFIHFENIRNYTDMRRKTAFNSSFKRTESETTTEKKTTTTTPQPHVFRLPYPFGPTYHDDQDKGFHLYEFPYHRFNINNKDVHRVQKKQQIQGDEVSLDVRNEDACNSPKILIYREKMKVVESYNLDNIAQFRITLFDKFMHNYTCLKIKIENGKLDINTSFIWFDTIIEREGTGFKGEDDTPSELLKYYLLPQKYNPQDAEDEAKFPYNWGGKIKHLEPKFVVDKINYEQKMDDENINLLIGFRFNGEASMDLLIYGTPKPRRIRPTTTARTTTLMTSTSTTSRPPVYWKRAHTFGELPYKPRSKKNRLEKAKERYAERKAIERKAKERKLTKIKVRDRQRKTNGTDAERNAVATTTESRNMFDNFPDISFSV